MANDKIIFNIAGLPLRIEGRKRWPLPDVLKNFLLLPKNRMKDIRRLDSAIFFSKKGFDDRLLSYAYSQILASKGGGLLHATAVSRGGKTSLFFGSSGGGKSTVAVLSRGHRIIGDDVVAVRRIGRGFYAYSTPWRQSGLVNASACIKGKIAALFFLKKSKRIHFKPLKPQEALRRIVDRHIHFLRYTEMPLSGKAFFAAEDLARGVPAYEMEFKKEADFWPLLEKTINGRR
jgi:hypothetical protein